MSQGMPAPLTLTGSSVHMHVSLQSTVTAFLNPVIAFRLIIFVMNLYAINVCMCVCVYDYDIAIYNLHLGIR